MKENILQESKEKFSKKLTDITAGRAEITKIDEKFDF